MTAGRVGGNYKPRNTAQDLREGAPALRRGPKGGSPEDRALLTYKVLTITEEQAAAVRWLILTHVPSGFRRETADMLGVI